MASSAYKSQHPMVLAALDEVNARVTEWRDAAWSFAATVGKRYSPMLLDGSSLFCAGLVPIEGEEPPEGWRLEHWKRRDVWVPDRRRKVGKDYAKRLAGLKVPSARTCLPGMPAEIWLPAAGLGFSVYRYGYFQTDPKAEDRTVYASWSIDVEAEVEEHGDQIFDFTSVRGIDSELWTRIKLSEYHAAREAHYGD